MLKLTFEAKTIPKDFTGMIESLSGRKDYLKNGVAHRDNGPAIEYPDGTKVWFHNGKLHRDNGPAIEYPDGSKQFWLDGVSCTEEKFKLELEKLKPTCDNKTVVIDGKEYKLVLV